MELAFSILFLILELTSLLTRLSSADLIQLVLILQRDVAAHQSPSQDSPSFHPRRKRYYSHTGSVLHLMIPTVCIQAASAGLSRNPDGS